MRRKREKDEKDQWEKAQKKNRHILKNYNLEKDREKRRQEMSKKKFQIGEKTREHQQTTTNKIVINEYTIYLTNFPPDWDS